MSLARDSRTRLSLLLASGNVLLAPMAGVTEAPFRGICKRYGAGLTYTEMVSAAGLEFMPGSAAAARLLALHPLETVYAVQLFGSDPLVMARSAARIVESRADAVALIDINMGCPVPKVVRKGEGAALMRDPDRATAIVREVARAVEPIPVTAKFRKGFAEGEETAVEFARLLVDAGAAGLAVHGRTRSQFYRGRADWGVIARVKAAVDVPVVGSGDVLCAADAARMLDATGCDAVMVARGALGNPWIFREARALIDEGREMPGPTAGERISVAREHARELCAAFGERALARMRKHVAWYLKGLPGASRVRERVNGARTLDQLEGILDEYGAWLEAGAPSV